MTDQRVIPMLAYEDASRAADWINKSSASARPSVFMTAWVR